MDISHDIIRCIVSKKLFPNNTLTNQSALRSLLTHRRQMSTPTEKTNCKDPLLLTKKAQDDCTVKIDQNHTVTANFRTVFPWSIILPSFSESNK